MNFFETFKLRPVSNILTDLLLTDVIIRIADYEVNVVLNNAINSPLAM